MNVADPAAMAPVEPAVVPGLADAPRLAIGRRPVAMGRAVPVDLEDFAAHGLVDPADRVALAVPDLRASNGIPPPVEPVRADRVAMIDAPSSRTLWCRSTLRCGRNPRESPHSDARSS